MAASMHAEIRRSGSFGLALANQRLHLTAAVGGARRLPSAAGWWLLFAQPAAVVASWFARGRR
jgi:hypothetical protein